MWANDHDSEWNGYNIKRGQLIRSASRIQNDISYIIHYTADSNRVKTPSITTVRRVLEDLKMKRFIDFKTVPHGYFITINNYEQLSNTPFTKMVRNIGNKMEHFKVSKKELLKPEGPKWLMEHWGYGD